MTTMDMTTGTLAKIVTDGGLELEKAQQLIKTFAPLAQAADKLARDAESIQVTDATQVSAMKEARKQRLALKDVRCDAETARKEAKADALKFGRIIDGIANHIKGICEPVEARLEECEKFAERAEAKRMDDLATARRAELQPVIDDLPMSLIALPDLRTMPEAAWTQYLDDARSARATRDENARKAAAEAEAKRQAEAAEREAQRLETERLRAEKAETDRKLAEAEAKARAEREALEAERQAFLAAKKAEYDAIEAKARAEREAAERKLAEERAEVARLQREKDARDAAEAQRRADEEQRARAAAAAPDAEKIRAFVDQVLAIVPPEMATEEGKIAMRRALNMRQTFAEGARNMAAALAGGAR